MNTKQLVFAFGMALVSSILTQAQAAEYKPSAGPFPVEVARFEWRDAKRSRAVPVKLYTPAQAKGPAPVIIFSHGLGGTREAYEYLGRHWASHGYASVHLQHQGSDDAVWRGNTKAKAAMQGAAADWRNAMNRPLDVRFALDELTRLNRDDPAWRGRFDLDRVGMSGHSFGGWTTLAASGMALGPVNNQELADPRIKAAISMSAPANQRNPAAYNNIKIPVYHLTGTLDDSPIGDTRAAERRIPYDQTKNAEKYLLILDGGDHMVFSGRSGVRGNRPKDPRFHELILMSTTAFWDAYLREDATAKDWLSGGAFLKTLGTDGTFESRNPVEQQRRKDTKPGVMK